MTVATVAAMQDTNTVENRDAPTRTGRRADRGRRSIASARALSRTKEKTNVNSWQVWLKGLAAAAVSGAATGSAQALNAGQFTKGTGAVAGIGAVAGLVMYLLKSPLPGAPAQQ